MVSICPRCFSTAITTTDRAALAAYRELYSRCRDCGLEAKLFPEVAVKDLSKLKKEREEQKKEIQKTKPKNREKIKTKKTKSKTAAKRGGAVGLKKPKN